MTDAPPPATPSGPPPGTGLIESAATMRARLATGQRLLGLDVGSKTVGLALSDALLISATPLETLRRGRRFRDDAAKLKDLLERESVGGLVYGWPVHMNGDESPRCQATRAFANNLYEVIPCPFLFWDERMSTAAVERTLIEADTSRAKRAQVVDKLAAAYILQGAMHAMG